MGVLAKWMKADFGSGQEEGIQVIHCSVGVEERMFRPPASEVGRSDDLPGTIDSVAAAVQAAKSAEIGRCRPRPPRCMLGTIVRGVGIARNLPGSIDAVTIAVRAAEGAEVGWGQTGPPNRMPTASPCDLPRGIDAIAVRANSSTVDPPVHRIPLVK